MIKASIEYLTIKDHYGSQIAKRSGIPLINHINEGIDILDVLVSSDEAKLAYCIHPLSQSGKDVSWSKVSTLANEYAYFANKYLCNHDTDHIKMIEQLDDHLHGDIDYHVSNDCIDMLIADKLQNRKDFMIYHYDSHDRSEQLYQYFNLWLSYLFHLKNKAT